jgi:hypothetical protein
MQYVCAVGIGYAVIGIANGHAVEASIGGFILGSCIARILPRRRLRATADRR